MTYKFKKIETKFDRDFFQKKLSEAIDQKINESGLTYQEISEKIDKTPSHTHRLIKWKTTWDDTLEKIAKISGYSSEEYNTLIWIAKIKECESTLGVKLSLGSEKEVSPEEWLEVFINDALGYCNSDIIKETTQFIEFLKSKK